MLMQHWVFLCFSAYFTLSKNNRDKQKFGMGHREESWSQWIKFRSILCDTMLSNKFEASFVERGCSSKTEHWSVCRRWWVISITCLLVWGYGMWRAIFLFVFLVWFGFFPWITKHSLSWLICFFVCLLFWIFPPSHCAERARNWWMLIFWLGSVHNIPV